MIPASIDIDSLAKQASDGGVAFYGQAQLSVDAQARLESDLASTVHELNAVGRDHVCVVVSNEGGISGPDLRDVAQAVDDATPCNLVVARAPGAISLVSDHYARADVERVEVGVAREVDYPASVRYVAEHLHQSSSEPGTIVEIGGVLCLATAVAAVIWQRHFGRAAA